MAILCDGRKLLLEEVTKQNAAENTAICDSDSDVDCDLLGKVARQQNPVFENKETEIRTTSLLPSTTGHRRQRNNSNNIPLSSRTTHAPTVGESPCSQRESSDGPSITCEPHQFLQLTMATFLCFQAWYKRCYPYNLRNDEVMTNVQYAISKMMSMIETKFPSCQERNGWKIQNFHELLHVPRSILVFGSQGNYNAGPGKHMLTNFA